MSLVYSLFTRSPKFFTVMIILCLSSLMFLNNYKIKINTWYSEQLKEIRLHEQIVEQFYLQRRDWNTSILGSILFKNEAYPKISGDRRNKTFLILFYKIWDKLQRRHLYYFGKKRHEPLEGCSVTNCEFSGSDTDFNRADAVVVHLHRGLIPKVKNRNPSKRWIFLDDESPNNSFALAKIQPKLPELYDVFNWSMTYRSESDIPVPYGRTIALKMPKIYSKESITTIIPNWKIKKHDVLISILISNCAVEYRMNILNELKKYIKVHVHGRCGDIQLKKSCPGHFKSDCKVMSQYLFYLALENSKCKEYITEKMFYHAYARGAIPIIQGPTIEDCEKVLPPNSYIHIDNYNSLQDLANDVIDITNNKNKLLSFHKWRVHFDVLNEHGYFGSKSYHLCRLCEAMNFNDHAEFVYGKRDIDRFLKKRNLCRN